MPITTEQLDAAQRAFAAHLHGEFSQVESGLSDVKSRLAQVEGVTSGTSNTALTAHVSSPEPHPAYDRDIPDLTVLFDNLLA